MSANPSLPAYDQPQIVRWLGASTVDKGRAHVGSVSNLTWDVNWLSGEVYGTRRDPYDVDVFFYPHGQRFEIDGHCTCSAGQDCKHVAAVLMALLEHRQADAPDRIDPSVRPEVVSWLEAFRRMHGRNGNGHASGGQGAKKPKPSQHALAYVITPPKYGGHHKVELFKASVREGGVRSIGDPWDNVEKALLKPPQFVSDADLSILRLLWLGRSRDTYYGYGLELHGSNGAAALERMAKTGRLFMKDTNGQAPNPLRSADPRPADMQWPLQPNDRFRPVLQTVPPSTAMILTEPPWYIDQVSGEAGVARLPWDIKRVLDYLTMPSVSAAEANIVATVLREVAPEMPTPPTLDPAAMRVVDVEPVPVLHLNTLPVYSSSFVLFSSKGSTPNVLDHATVSFDYDGFRFEPQDTSTLKQTASKEVVQVKRRADVERSRLAELRQAGMVHVKPSSVYGPQPFPQAMLGLKDTQGWPEFMHETLPGLRKGGWRVEMASEFRFNVVEIESIDGHLHEAADGWFDLEMGIVVADRHVRLEPLLAELFRRDRRWLAGSLDSIADDEAIELTTDVGERLRLRADRLKPVVRVLIDLFEGLGDGAMRVSRFDAGRLEALSDTGRWQFHGDDSLRQLAQRLRGGKGVGEAHIPQGLSAELRTYQHQGLSWMQFLRDHDLSGVLADDMGLGKTVQTLAHVLAEKEAGRLDRPTLIVVPTSLVHNWCEEARRFAPGLRVLSLHGSQRKDRFDEIAEHDLVLTTYALLWRDHVALARHQYHLLILDEAQFVKNASTKSATAIRELQARHRLCLTGTPLENHLGELWSLFDFLLPGFLGTQKDFAKRWRTPIEKGGDTVRRDLLARRIRPFMLRRRKDEVAKELPAKTMIVRSVELDGAQRDLYETVRAAMQDKVREAISQQGLGRSHIVVLDALLKLRQVCCDPRLVKLTKASTIKGSAKLELLLSMLPDLIEEGRRVLLFSQFTGMLSLIAAALDKAGIAYVTLTGDTTDRATPVRRFQAGEVPLFLISLKAGGVGLNLTSADTVIHYDPWWNPAAENQATDRAHRLGQDKPVFVYKLIVAGSIEEKIVSMQDKKAALADGILSEDAAVAVKFSADDLEALFAPMPAVG